MLRIATVVGARPQFVKAAAVSRRLADLSDVRETLIHTGQHYDDRMSDVFFRELGLRSPDHYLGIGGGLHGEQTGRMLEAVERVLLAQPFDIVLVYGDTNSTLAGALAAAKLHLPVAHVEAGLRSFDRRMPEEVNRVLTDHLSAFLFSPTKTAVGNLAREGIAGDRVQLVGDVMYDIALRAADESQKSSSIIERLGVTPGEFALATVHRPENTDDPARLLRIVDALALISHELPIVFPMHPRTAAAVRDAGIDVVGTNEIVVTEPLGYLDMIALERNAAAVVTDSGGVQKEAYFFGTPCVTLRRETEWVELVASGWNRLAPPDDAKVVAAAVLEAVQSPLPSARPALYGDGNAAALIACALVESTR